MVQERPTTPEKQLLGLIEDPKEQDLSQRKIKRKSFSLISFSALKGRLSFLRESIRSGSFFRKDFLDVKALNRILKICIVALSLYLIGNFVMSIDRLREVPEFVAKNGRLSKEISSTESFGRKISYYLESPRSRNIFKFGDFVVEEELEEGEYEEVAAPIEKTISKAELLSQKLGLVGISWSDDPDVMVENLGTKKIYFLKRGQRIDGLIKVEAIFEDRVILTYDDGKEMELQ